MTTSDHPRVLSTHEIGGWLRVGDVLVAPTARTVLVAYGHHRTTVVLPALEHLAHHYLGWPTLAYGFGSQAAVVAALHKRWGRFTGHNPIDWELDYSRTEPGSPRTYPVTILDCTPHLPRPGGPR